VLRMSVEERLITRLDELIEKADHVLAAHRPNPPNYIGFTTLGAGEFTEWQTQCLSFLVNLLGAEHVYVESFRKTVESEHTSDVQAGKGNHADHGEFSEYQDSDVRDMLAGTREFLGNHL
jgi:hypothetical protein